jgi:membrane-associated phospholipid phosphatase
MGKENAFLLLNIDLGPTSDFLFYIWANAGDGFIWIPAFALTLMYKKKFIPFLIATIVFSTITTQSSKQVFFKSENRPTAVITNASLIHKVPGIEIHTTNSFPSGHTATAFSLFLFCCFISAKKWIVPVGFAYALLGGYARIYVAQHFPIDVGAGILVAYCSILLSWVIHIHYFNK